MHPEEYPDFADDRHCLVFWARPPSGVRSLIADIQKQLLTVAPSLIPEAIGVSSADWIRVVADAYRMSPHDCFGNRLLTYGWRDR